MNIVINNAKKKNNMTVKNALGRANVMGRANAVGRANAMGRANSNNSISINIDELKIARLNKLRTKEMTKGLTQNEEKEFNSLLKQLEKKNGGRRNKRKTLKRNK
jgi:hypothetical protein